MQLQCKQYLIKDMKRRRPTQQQIRDWQSFVSQEWNKHKSK